MRSVRFALLAALAFAAAPAHASNWYDLPFPSTIPPAEAPLENLYIQFDGDAAPTRVADIILQPPHTGHYAGPKLQLPQQINTTRLSGNVNTRELKMFDLNRDGVLNRSELTQAMISWAVTSIQNKPFAKARFFYGYAANALAPLDFFVLNLDDSSYVRRVIVLHGHTGSLEMLETVARAG